MSPRERLRESSLRALRRAGPVGALGAALIVGAILVGIVGDAANETRREALAAERARLLRGGTATAGGVTGRGELEAFYAAFPPQAGLPATLARVHAQADAHALDVERAQYRSVDEAAAPLLRVSLSLPVRGEFGDIAAWLGEMLTTMPEVALEAFTVRRADPALGTVEGEVRLQVFARRRP